MAVKAATRPALSNATHVSYLPPTEHNALLERIEHLEARLEALERRSRPRDADDTRVLLAVASSIGGRRFSAAEVIRDAPWAPELAEALEAADCDSPRSLGRLFARLEGRDLHGLRLERVAEDRFGIVWVVRVCTPHVAP
jgi:hypothetical protein